MTLTQEALHALPLRRLSVDPASHPRGQSFLSAASGLVCRHGRACVVAEDELHLGVFHDTATPGQLHRVLPGELLESKEARKRRKPDLETLVWWPQARAAHPAAQVAARRKALATAARNDAGHTIASDFSPSPEPTLHSSITEPVNNTLIG